MGTGEERIKNFPPRAPCRAVLGDSFTRKIVCSKEKLIKETTHSETVWSILMSIKSKYAKTMYERRAKREGSVNVRS